jgi:PAS domain S-box-containing protein
MSPSHHDRIEVVAESIPHIVWLSAPDGSTDFVNERGTEYTGRPPEASYGWKWLDLVHEDDASTARRAYEHAVATATPFELEYRLRRSDGRYRWHAFRALPIRGAGGEVERWVGTAVDIDTHVQVTERLKRIQDQTSDLLSLLETVQPEPESFRVVTQAVQAVHVNAALAGDDPPAVDREAPAAQLPLSRGESPGAPALSEREKEVLRLLALGCTNQEIANKLAVSLRTVEGDRARVRRALGLSTRGDLVRFALDSGLAHWD